MLESMRKHAKSWVAKVMLIGIILSFALWGVGDYFTGNHVEYVAEIDGTPVTDGEFQLTYQRQLNNYRQMLGKNFSQALMEQLNVKDTTLQTIINRRLMLNEADNMGLVAPEDALLLRVQNDPIFQSTDGFDAERYNIITRNMGFLSTRDYENDLRLNMLIEALQQSIIGNPVVNEADIRQRFAAEFEKRVLTAIIVDPEAIKASITMDDDAAHTYYEDHADRYQSALKVGFSAIEIDPAQVATQIVVDDAAVKAAFEERKASFQEPEQRRASHILAQFTSTSEEAKAMARNKIDQIKARLEQGEDFAKIAKETSDDTSTASNGGDLGLFKRGVMLAEFDDVIFSMSKDNISDVVETQFGYHLIRLNEIQTAKEVTLTDIYETLAASLRDEQAAEEAYQRSQDLDHALGMEGSLKAAAASIDLPVQTIAPVDFQSAVGNRLLSHRDVRNKVFSSMMGDSVDIMELDDGRFVAIEVTERVEPQTQDFSEVAAKVYDDARRDAANQKAQAMAKEILEAGNTQSIDQLVQQFGQAKFISKPMRSNGEGSETSEWITGEMVQQAFEADAHRWLSAPMRTSRGWAVINVSDVLAADESLFAKEQARIRQDAIKAKGAVRFARWMASLRDRHDIVIHNKVLKRL